MLKRFLFALALSATALLCAHDARSQAVYTASRAGDLQVGVDGVLVNSDYETKDFRGAGFYSTFDFKPHFGAEIDFRQANSSQGTGEYERTYEVGARYLRHYGRFTPYIKAMYGRGVFNFSYTIISPTTGAVSYGLAANLAYNEFVGGVGVDIAVARFLNVRADFEYQDWLSFPPNGLTSAGLLRSAWPITSQAVCSAAGTTRADFAHRQQSRIPADDGSACLCFC